MPNLVHPASHKKYQLLYFDIFEMDVAEYHPDEEPQLIFVPVRANGMTILAVKSEFRHKYLRWIESYSFSALAGFILQI